jgi:uncharacterized protein with ParB-like and HNH nuclease domain
MNRWKPESFSAVAIDENIKSGKFKVPIYQRGLVWSKKKEDLLIDTIKRGLPFGTILLYYSELSNSYQIIDGLQRCNTIRKFINNPAQFFSLDDLDNSTINSLYEISALRGNKELIKEQISDILINWVKIDHETMKDVQDMQFFDFALELKKQLPIFSGKEKQIIEFVKPTLSNYKMICNNMISTEIPAIIILGDDKQLPEIFERINSEGQKLSKYQIYSASWTQNKFNISNKHFKELVQINKERYESLLDSAFEMTEFDPAEFTRLGELNVFEIAFGFGKYISKKYPHLFAAKDDCTLVESVGFNLINSCLGAKNKNLHVLHDNFKGYVGEDKVNEFAYFAPI